MKIWARTPLLPRDGEASSAPLTAGAIAGIACGAGALLLGAASLFIIYFRRQRRYAREDFSDSDSFDDATPRSPMTPAVAYTMDYKMDDPQHHGGSSYACSPDEEASYAFSQQSLSDVASAMPTHPAYIPRALVRGSASPSSRSVATTSPPPSVSHSSKIQPDDATVGAYLAATAQGEPSARPRDVPREESDASSSSDQNDHQSASQQPRHEQEQEQEPPLFSPSGRPPPPARPGPAAGTTAHAAISGPLAFPPFCHQPHGIGPSLPPAPATADIWDSDGGRRTFRGRRVGGHSGRGENNNNDDDDKAGGRRRRRGKKKHRRKRSDWSGSSSGGGRGGNRHYTEIEIGRGSDIW
ncbi:hypothetical protein VTH06DRAFT_1268 [Thermothelomyces fergusii]